MYFHVSIIIPVTTTNRDKERRKTMATIASIVFLDNSYVHTPNNVITDVALLADDEIFDADAAREYVEAAAYRHFNVEGFEVVSESSVDGNLVHMDGYITAFAEDGDGENDIDTYGFVIEKHIV